MTPILQALALSYTFPGAVCALDALTLDIPRGRCLALLGPNGSGKSTLLQHLNGTLRPQRGEVRLDGVPVRYDRKGLDALRQRVGLVLQDADDQLFAASVFEDISFGPLNLGLDGAAARERVDGAMQALGLEALAERPPHMLSGGQKKRVAIAGALAMRPEVLLLDEPTAGLDHEGAHQLADTLRPLIDSGMTLVFSTHDVDLACRLADDVALFSSGTLVAHGPRETVLRDARALAAARLAPSLFLTLLHELTGTGRLAPDAPMPREAAEILPWLRSPA